MQAFGSWVLVLLLWPSLASCGLLEEIERGFKNAVDCSSCHSLLPSLQTLAHLGDGYFVKTIVNICKDLRIEDADVCEGAIKDQGPILAHDLRHFSLIGQTSTKFCDAVFGLCQPPAVNEFVVPFPQPIPENPPVFTSSGSKPFQVIHFSDVHIDRKYAVDSEANCTKPICCRNWDDTKTGPIKARAGPMGNRKCDTPVPLMDSMLEAARKFGANAKFSIFTGDVIEHAVWAVNEAGVTGDMQAFNNELIEKLHAPVFPVLGNHESAPVNGFPRNTTSTDMDAEWVFRTQAAGWNQWIGTEASSQVTYNSGSYSAVALPGLRIISVNTQYWYKQNFWLYDSDDFQPDPNGVLAFIVQELQAAEDAGQRAWIIGHTPPGKGDILSDQSNYFDQIVQRYKHTIAGQFYGHTHRDEFAIGYSDYENQIAENAITVAMIGPAVVPNSGNPAFKIYDIDPDTFEIMDAHTYYANMTARHYQRRPTWELYYSARETYGALVPGLPPTSPLTPAFWHNLTEVFINNETAFFQFNVRRTRGATRMGSCKGTCKNGTICDMRTLRAEYNCDSPSGPARRLLDVQEGDTSPHHDTDACEGAGIGHILRSVVAKLSSLESTGTEVFEEHPDQVTFEA